MFVNETISTTPSTAFVNSAPVSRSVMIHSQLYEKFRSKPFKFELPYVAATYVAAIEVLIKNYGIIGKIMYSGDYDQYFCLVGMLAEAGKAVVTGEPPDLFDLPIYCGIMVQWLRQIELASEFISVSAPKTANAIVKYLV